MPDWAWAAAARERWEFAQAVYEECLGWCLEHPCGMTEVEGGCCEWWADWAYYGA